MLSIFGYGRVSKAIISTYKAGEWSVYDDKFISSSEDEFGNKLLPSNSFDPSKSTVEVVSPGIPPSNELCKKAKHLTSEIDFYYDAMPLSIWVSGTNGKTTTTQMISYLLDIEAGANIGKPLALMDLKKPLIVLELSSFALHYTKIARPEIYALLPIEDDHASWHGSFSEYEKSKLSPIFRMSKTASVIVPRKYEKNLSCVNCVKYFYDDTKDLAKTFGIDISKLNFSEPFLLDAVLALASAKIAKGEIYYEKINSFKIGEHRKEEFKDKNGRLWVNDSKATNIGAALAAIKSYQKPLHLIAGGDEKGQNMEYFFKSLPKNTKLYLIGVKDFSDLAIKYGFNPIRTNLKEAVKLMYDDLKENEVALLSPACASLDQFSSYEERGKLFKSYVKELDA